MIFKLCTFILVIIFISSSTATFCSNLTSSDDKDTPCFLESSTPYPARLRSSGNSLVLPCHVAHSKRSIVEWWYQDFQKSINIKIYPVFPAVRPTVLRFITSTSPVTKNSNETDIIDVSVLLRYVNVDDSGIYRCIIHPWTPDHVNGNEDTFSEDNTNFPALTYHIHLTGPRLCQSSLGALPCFSNMRTSSPTFVDAYQTAFLQCVVHNHNRPVSVFWVVGNESVNNVLITDYLSTNQHNGDRLRRVFPLSPFDYSIELSINSDVRERAYSCVIDGATDVETTLFTYIVRSIDINLEDNSNKTIKVNKNVTVITNESTTEKSTIKIKEITAHDVLSRNEIDNLRLKTSHEQGKTKDEKKHGDDDDDNIDDLPEFSRREETTAKN